MPLPAPTTTPAAPFQTLEEIQARKNELKASIQSDSQKIGELWHGLTAPQPANSTGELVANLVTNSVTAIDAFLLVRKLTRTYGTLFNLFRKKKKR